MMNVVILIGRLTKDPTLNFAPNSGTGVCKITLAVSRDYNSDEADFINCTAFGKTAETIAQYLLKGSKISVRGHIKTSSYEKDGEKKYTQDVIIEKFDFLESRKNINQENKNSDNNFNDDDGFQEAGDEGIF